METLYLFKDYRDKGKNIISSIILSFNLAIDGWPKDVGEPFPRG